MIVSIAVEDYPRHRQNFCVSVQDIFPMLSYTPSQTEAFLRYWWTLGEDHSAFLVETQSGSAYGRRIGWDVQYLIPSNWDKRYAMLQESLEEIKTEFLCSGTEKLSLGISDGFPSHTLYYAGMLPLLGFEVHSGEITFQAPDDLLSRLSLPALPLGVSEVRGDRERLPEYAALYAQAHAAHEVRLLSAPDHQKWLTSLDEAARNADVLKTWVGLEFGGRIVASCYGGCRPEHWGNFLSVEELAVLPEFVGKGLGRYALIRCLQELQGHYGVRGRPFQIGTWRHLGPRPLRLYLGLGFQVIKAETYSTFWKG